jgi:hypothetical protein
VQYQVNEISVETGLSEKHYKPQVKKWYVKMHQLDFVNWKKQVESYGTSTFLHCKCKACNFGGRVTLRASDTYKSVTG